MGQLIEIIFFALISAYLFYKLWVVMGQETDEDLDRRDRRRKTYEEESEDNVVPLRPRQNSSPFSNSEENEEANLKQGVKEGLRQIRLQEPNFVLNDFTQGSCKAYQLIVEAYSEGDTETLKGLLTDKVYQQFVKAIKEQKAEGTITKTSLEHIDRADIDAIEVVDNQAKITVRFRSRQIIITKSANGAIVDNPAEISIPITDIWTFVRTLNDPDPIWYLKATSSESYRD